MGKEGIVKLCKAFTLWELVLAVTVMGILSGVAYPLYYGVRQSGEDRVMVARVLALRAALITLEDRTPNIHHVWLQWSGEERFQQLLQRKHLRDRGLSWAEYQNGYTIVWPDYPGGKIRLYDPQERMVPYE